YSLMIGNILSHHGPHCYFCSGAYLDAVSKTGIRPNIRIVSQFAPTGNLAARYKSNFFSDLTIVSKMDQHIQYRTLTNSGKTTKRSATNWPLCQNRHRWIQKDAPSWAQNTSRLGSFKYCQGNHSHSNTNPDVTLITTKRTLLNDSAGTDNRTGANFNV